MSVSSRDRKDVIYAEVERLRALVAQQEQQLRSAHEELEQLRTAHEEGKRPRAAARPQAPDVSERGAQLAAVKALALKYRCTARLRDGVIELFSRKRGCWVSVPEGAQP